MLNLGETSLTPSAGENTFELDSSSLLSVSPIILVTVDYIK